MKLNFLGDVYLSNETNFSGIDMQKYAPYVFNFEFAHYGSEHPHALHKILLKSETDIAGVFQPLPAAVDIDNNHIFDYGDAGAAATVSYLSEKGVHFFGMDIPRRESSNPCILEIDGKKIALLGYYHRNRDKGDGAYKLVCFSEDRFLSDVQRSKELGAEIIIPSVHWGVEDSPVFTKMQQDAAHFMVDHGAELVIGHHPHCIQPWECYQGKYIFYSLGNFVFDDIYSKARYTDEEHYPCMQCKRWHRWHRTSLGVAFDTETREVTLRQFYQKKHAIKETEHSSDALFQKYRSVRGSSFRTLLRKMISSVSSFFFFHGHIFYWPGFREELKLVIALHAKEKNWNYSE